MNTLAHISDIHLAPLPPVRAVDLIGKRITGFLNWKMTRAKTLDGEGLTNLVRHMRDQAPDFVAVTGDLTNLALEAEINTAFNWLQTVGDADRVCVSPGNHDAYVPGALGRALTRWGDYVRGETVSPRGFPFVRRIGEMGVISCSSAVPTAPWISAGSFSEHQAERLARCLRLLGDGGYFRVVLIHHPPDKESFHPRLGLWGGGRFRDVIEKYGAELILHGHTHKSSMHSVPGPIGDIPVVGVAAAGAAQEGTHGDDPGRYNLFRIERVGTSWSCTMREYGFQRLGSDIVLRLQMRIY